MATGLSATQANSILAALTGQGAAFGPSAACYCKLHTGDPGSAGANNAATNATRIAATFSAPSAGSITTSADILWTSVSTTETYTHVSFWTASSAGTFLFSAPLTSSVAVTAGNDFKIPAGSEVNALTPIAA